MNYATISLGQLLTSDDVTIKRNAISILKVLQNCDHAFEPNEFGRHYCIYCFRPAMSATNKKNDLCNGCNMPVKICSCIKLESQTSYKPSQHCGICDLPSWQCKHDHE